jgi:hypothetical protein
MGRSARSSHHHCQEDDDEEDDDEEDEEETAVKAPPVVGQTFPRTFEMGEGVNSNGLILGGWMLLCGQLPRGQRTITSFFTKTG